MEPKALAGLAVASLDKHKAEDIKVIGVTELTSIADYFVIASGTSSTMVKSLSDYVEEELKTGGTEPSRVEGYASSSWVLMITRRRRVHIFQAETRTFYDLERLWKDGRQLEAAGFSCRGQNLDKDHTNHLQGATIVCGRSVDQLKKKWQKIWEEENTFAASEDREKPKFYALVEFPYPSGQGLHVGHPRSYTALDVVAPDSGGPQGYNVLDPTGGTTFGLPIENFAIKNHIHPEIVTKNNVARFKSQLQALGLSFDWTREINTTDPDYYKWTQWIFLQLFKHGLAYKKEMAVNWCTSCKCVLANEEVVGGVCERCGGEVVHKVKSQWMLKITEYAQRLIDRAHEQGLGKALPNKIYQKGQNRRYADFGTVVESCSKKLPLSSAALVCGYTGLLHQYSDCGGVFCPRCL